MMPDSGPVHGDSATGRFIAPSTAAGQLRHLHARIFEIARSSAVLTGDVPGALEALTRFCVEAFKVKRAGVWVASTAGDAFLCERLYDGARRLFESGEVLMREAHDDYFRALEGAQVLAVRDAAADPRTRGFAQYLSTHGIVSTLDAVIYRGAGIAGTVCLEHTGVRREWRAEEEVLIAVVADVAASVLAAHARCLDSEHLWLEERRFRDLFEDADDVIYCMDGVGYLTEVNRAAERLTGFTREEVIGRSFSDFVAPESMALAVSRFRDAVSGAPEGTPYEIDLVCKNGARITLEITGRLVEKNGRPVEIHGIGREVSARRALEAQLRHAQKMEALGRLAGGVAHDFNNLLTAIIGYAEQATDRTGLDRELSEDLNEILGASRRAATLTRQLLAFSRRQVVHPTVLDVNATIAGMQAMLRRVIGEDVLLVATLDSAPALVRADAGQIEQIVVNLAVNAREAMPEGGRLEIRTSVSDGAIVRSADGSGTAAARGPRVVISVSDTGLGIDAATRAKMFEPFFTTKEFGTGLGLSTVFGIVREMAGDIEVDSQKGIGTTLNLSLPRCEGPAASDYQIAARSPGGTECILLVEDDDSVRSLARRILSRNGYLVLDAKGPEEALRISRDTAGEIRLVISDVVMPGMSAREFTRQLATIRSEFKVIYMSGYAREVLGTLSSAQAPFLQKPFSKDDLLRQVREALDAPGPVVAPVSRQ